MPGVASIARTEHRIKKLFWILLILAELVWMHGYAVSSSERHTLILVNEDTGSYIHALELLPTGEIVTTGQDFNVGGSFYEQIGVSPDSRFVWCGAYINSIPGYKQYAVSSYGQLTETGRIIEGNGSASNIKFTPNEQMLFPGGPIYRAYANGSVESTANYWWTGGHISPRGDIDLVLTSRVYVFRIDYSGFSVYNIQTVMVDDGATSYDAAYTPEGDYVAIINGGGTPVDVDIYSILGDGSLDTTRVQQFDMGTSVGSIAISKDGKFLYVAYWDQLYIAVLRRIYTTDGPYEDTGIRVPITYYGWQMIVSPDGKYLVTNGHAILESFEIQDDGSLISKCQFNFSATFGKDPHYFQFAYPEAPTELDSQWQLYE